MQYFYLTLVILLVFACNPYRHTNRAYKQQAKIFARQLKQKPERDSINRPSYWVGTTNFNMRRPNFVIIHHTAQNSCDQTLKTFTLPRTQVSAHYVICKDGRIHHMLNDYLRAWHGGLSKWGALTDINSTSIGIELDNNGRELFSEMQMTSLYRLLDTLKKRYNIPQGNFIGHADIAPKRKNDPNIYFPWLELNKRGFGNWYGDTSMISVPENFDALLALRTIGYDTRDSIAAIIAFKRHFIQDTIPVIGDAEKKIIYSLVLQQ